MKKNGHTINYRIAMCFLVSFFILGGMIVYHYITFRNTRLEELYTVFSWDGNYIQTELQRTVETIEDTAQTAGYTTAMQKTLFADAASEKISHINTARELISTSKDKSDYIVDLFYFSNSSHIYTQSAYNRHFRADMEQHGFDKDTDISNPFFSDTVISEHNARFFLYYIPIYRTAAGIAYDTRNKGICAVLCNFAKLLPNSEEILKGDYATYLLYDEHIISLNSAASELGTGLALRVGDGSGTITDNEEEYYYYSVADSPVDERWRVVCLANKEVIGIDSYIVDSRFYMLVVAGSLFFIIMLLYLSRDFTKAVKNMINDLNSMQNSSDDRRITVPKVRELKTIAEQINDMIDRIKESDLKEQQVREQLYSAVIAQQNAEMMAYRSQINPHFLFNTLECIRSMAQEYNAELIEDMVGAMSKMFEYSLYSRKVVPFAKELDMLEQYFFITSVRFPERYVLEKEIAENTLDFHVPSMIVQPLVENCIKHAFRKRRPGNRNIIKINAEITADGLLKISVTDNGCGMTGEELEALKARNMGLSDNNDTAEESIGIHNIFKRIKLFSADNRMEYYSEPGKYTRVELYMNPIVIDVPDGV